MKQISTILLRQVLVLSLIFGLAVTLFFPLKDYVPAVLGAYTLYVLLRRVMFSLIGRFQWPSWLGAGLLLIVAMTAIAVPLYLLAQILQSRLVWAVQHSPEIMQSVENTVHGVEQKFNVQLLKDNSMNEAYNWVVGQASTILNASLKALLNFSIVFFTLFFMLCNGQKMEAAFFHWLPLRSVNIAYLKSQLNELVYANAVGIPLTALSQGLVALPVYMLLHVPDPWVWFTVTCIAGMLPVVGAALAYVPLSLMLMGNGDTGKGTIMLIYGFLIIGTIDNITRIWLQKKLGDTHPLITLFGVIAGVKLFGFIGLIFGPILFELLLLLLRIYNKEFGKSSVQQEE